MQTTGNTILITGGGTGIGRGRAEAFHALGNKVIVAGRREQPLKETAAANPGIEFLTLDVQNAESVTAFAAEAIRRFPTLNAVIHNAGIMQREDLLAPAGDSSAMEATINTNLIAPLRLTTALLPHLLEQPKAAILTVSSGLAFIPRADTPTYSATKAAIHSWTQSLRFQLRKTRVEVLEIIPPYVQTELSGAHQARDPRAMPLAEYIAEVMTILAAQPASKEISVQRVYPQRYAGDSGVDKEKGLEEYNGSFTRFNKLLAGEE